MIFKRENQTFEGIRSLCGLRLGMPFEAKFLAQVEADDENEYWWLENREIALEELNRYYRMYYSDGYKIRLFAPV